jgi:hypothetical protein
MHPSDESDSESSRVCAYELGMVEVPLAFRMYVHRPPAEISLIPVSQLELIRIVVQDRCTYVKPRVILGMTTFWSVVRLLHGPAISHDVGTRRLTDIAHNDTLRGYRRFLT